MVMAIPSQGGPPAVLGPLAAFLRQQLQARRWNQRGEGEWWDHVAASSTAGLRHVRIVDV
jgi:hypothetical protein